MREPLEMPQASSSTTRTSSRLGFRDVPADSFNPIAGTRYLELISQTPEQTFAVNAAVVLRSIGCSLA